MDTLAVNINEALHNTTRLFLDTAPVIYYVEQNPHYSARTQHIFDAIDTGNLTAVTSPITLAESLIVPYRLGLLQLQQDFLISSYMVTIQHLSQSNIIVHGVLLNYERATTSR